MERNKVTVFLVMAALAGALGTGYVLMADSGTEPADTAYAAPEARTESGEPPAETGNARPQATPPANPAASNIILPSPPGPLGDIALGNPEAPLTIVEYASMTCNHCASFHLITYKKLKENYIDTGKVYYVVREFPLDPVATAAIMVARCSGEERFHKFINVLFQRQAEWAFVEDPLTALEALARQGGFTEESFRSCLQDGDLLNHVRTVQKTGWEELNIRSTPSFFFNGQLVEGGLPYEAFEALVKEALENQNP